MTKPYWTPQTIARQLMFAIAAPARPIDTPPEQHCGLVGVILLEPRENVQLLGLIELDFEPVAYIHPRNFVILL